MKKLIFLLLLSSVCKANIKDSVRNYIETHQELQFKRIVYKQFIWETGHFKSVLFKKYNNIAGIKFNKKGYCIGKVKGYASYCSWKESIEDYLRIQYKILKKYPARTEKEYLIALRKYGYAKENYFSKL